MSEEIEYRATGRLIVGIDCGGTPRTGLAVYDADRERLLRCTSVGFWTLAGIFMTELLPEGDGGRVALVVIEDPRRLPLYARHNRVRGRRRDRLARRVGRVDRDVALWEEGLTDWGYAVQTVEPVKAPKWTAETMARITGWVESTNEHGRDAARLVWGRKAAVTPAGLS